MIIINKNKINGTKQVGMSETELEVGSTEDVEGIKLTEGIGVGRTHTQCRAADPCSLHHSFLFNVHILIQTMKTILIKLEIVYCIQGRRLYK